ncbi:hypothetical protein [Longicatena caecimuris]|uniref:hypothetical protein n=1 Tax=Longicatena caecimuris TaxID=1796635 RepID=UPI003AB3ECAD
MNLIDNLLLVIFSTLISSTICIYLQIKTKKLFTLNDYDLNIYKRKLEIYSYLYTGLVKDQLGNRKELKDSLHFVIQFCKEIINSKKIHYFISPNCLQILNVIYNCQSKDINDKHFKKKLQFLIYVVEEDYNKILIKLDLSSLKKAKKIYSLMFTLAVSITVFITFQLIKIYLKLYSYTEQALIGSICSALLVVLAYISLYLVENRFIFFKSRHQQAKQSKKQREKV